MCTRDHFLRYTRVHGSPTCSLGATASNGCQNGWKYLLKSVNPTNLVVLYSYLDQMPKIGPVVPPLGLRMATFTCTISGCISRMANPHTNTGVSTCISHSGFYHKMAKLPLFGQVFKHCQMSKKVIKSCIFHLFARCLNTAKCPESGENHLFYQMFKHCQMS